MTDNDFAFTRIHLFRPNQFMSNHELHHLYSYQIAHLFVKRISGIRSRYSLLTGGSVITFSGSNVCLQRKTGPKNNGLRTHSDCESPGHVWGRLMHQVASSQRIRVRSSSMTSSTRTYLSLRMRHVDCNEPIFSCEEFSDALLVCNARSGECHCERSEAISFVRVEIAAASRAGLAMTSMQSTCYRLLARGSVHTSRKPMTMGIFMET